MFICRKLSCWTETIEWCMCRLRYGLLPANGKPGSLYRLSEQLKDVGHTVHCWIGLQKYAPVLHLQVSQTTKTLKSTSIRHCSDTPVGLCFVWCHNGPILGSCAISDIRSKLILTLSVRGPSYLGLTRSISWLLMPWLLTSPGHQQPWYWLYRICWSFSYLRKDFKYLCHINVEEWHKLWIYVFVPSEKYNM